MRTLVQIVGVLLLAGLTGCASLPETYRPWQVGALPDDQSCDGVALRLATSTDTVPLGQPVIF